MQFLRYRLSWGGREFGVIGACGFRLRMVCSTKSSLFFRRDRFTRYVYDIGRLMRVLHVYVLVAIDSFL